MQDQGFRGLVRLLFTFLMALVAGCASTSEKGEDLRESTTTGFVREALANGRSYDLLRELCTVAPHRLSGSTGAASAIEWARRAMEAEGLENVRLEPCTVPRWIRGSVAELVVVEPSSHAGERLPILALGGSEATPPDGIEAEVIAVESFDELTRLADQAKGRIVLFNRPLNEALLDPFRAYGGAANQRTRGAIRAAQVGAVASLCRSLTMRRDDVPHTGAMRYDPEVRRIPAAACSTNAADRIAAWLADGEKVRLRLSLDCRTEPPVDSFNVVGEVVGWERPEEIVVVGGHLDAWDVGQGAHDDGAGCVQAIEALSIIERTGHRPRRTLRCVLFMNEENGLAGGRAYAEAHASEHHVLAIESDRGGFTPRGFTTTARGEVFEILEELVALQAKSGADKFLAGGGGADIGPLAQFDVPLVGYLPDPQRYFDLHHSGRDKLDQVNPRELSLGAAAIASLAWLVADLPQTLPPNPPAEQ